MDTAAIRVSNLSENTQEGDLQELFKPFGHIARIYLAKDKITGQCKVIISIVTHGSWNILRPSELYQP